MKKLFSIIASVLMYAVPYVAFGAAFAVGVGGTGTTSQITNGVAYYNGSLIKTGTGLTYTGTNFGVGTSSPSALLTVGGNMQIFPSGDPVIELESGGSAAHWQVTAYNSTGYFSLYNYTNNRNPFFVVPTAPSNALVIGSSYVQSSESFLSSNGSSAGTILDINGIHNYYVGQNMIVGGSGTINFQTYSGGWGTRMVVANSGNIGIATTSPAALLDFGPGTASVGQLHFASSVLKTTPVAGDMEYSDGHWYLTDGERHTITTSSGVLTSTATAVNTTASTTVYTYTFAPGTFHANEHIKLDIMGVVSNASASDDYNLAVALNGTNIHVIPRLGGNVTNQGTRLVYEGTVRTTGAGGTFVDYVEWKEGSLSQQYADTTTHAIDTTAANTITVVVQWANAKAGNTYSITQGFLTFTH